MTETNNTVKRNDSFKKSNSININNKIKKKWEFKKNNFLQNVKKELKQYGYEVEKISRKEKSVTFAKIV